MIGIGKVIGTALFSEMVLFILVKIIGHKEVAQLDLFDYINGITIGSIAAELATELEEPWKPLTAMVVYGCAAVSLSFITSKFPRMRKYINGSPTILMDDGKLYRKNMKKAKIDLSEFLVMCRQQGYFNLGDIQTAVFEYNGKLTILPHSNKRPVNPGDMNLNPQQEHMSAEVIIDGRILGENLRRMGKDESWLNEQLHNQGFQSPEEIFLGVCDDKQTLSFYRGEQ